jgi:DNA helicase-2/ATP-dependent DNA helicase PcrA
MESLQYLSLSQREAVTTTEGYVRVIAGAGSGKTKALSHRFAHLVNEIGVLPANILCVTFTNKAAGEMRQRIRRLVGDNDTGPIGTFHSLCVTILQEDISGLGYPKSFLVLDNADIDAMLALIYEERGLTLRDMTFARARDKFEIRKLSTEPDYHLDILDQPLEVLHQKFLGAVNIEDILFYGYLYQARKCFALDYNDLIRFVLHLFEINSGVREKWQDRLEYVMVDEFQDIDPLQHRLMRVLCGRHRNLFVVGDPDQTIYSWRGADIRFLLDFDKDFPGTRTISMLQNYRSTPEIIEVANSLIANNRQRIRKQLVPLIGSGPRPIFHHARTARDEALWMVTRIRELVAAGTRFSEIAVLYRAHHVSRAVEEVLITEKIPYVIHSGVQFFARAEVKDALSYLRLVGCRDDLSFRRVANTPKRNLGERRMRFLEEAAMREGCTLYKALCRYQDHEIFKGTRAHAVIELVDEFTARSPDVPVSELLAELLDKSGYEAALRTAGSQERLDNLAELKQSIHDFETTCGEEATLESYLTHVALFTGADLPEKDAIRLMTVHAAKGLEFGHVFLCGMAEGVFPTKRTASIQSMEEERRLAFVAVTRAKQGLCLSDSEGRNLDGSFRIPSRFVLDIDRQYIDHVPELPANILGDARLRIELSQKTLAAASEEPTFGAGARVRHPILGPGVIQDVDRGRRAYTVRFQSVETPRAISFRVQMESVAPASGR